MPARKKDFSDITLREFMEKGFIAPKLANGTLTEPTAAWYRTIVNLVEEVFHVGVLCREIDSEALSRFTIRLRSLNYHQRTIETYTQRVRCLLRRWNPEWLPNRKPGLAAGTNLNFADVDVDGSLEQLFMQKYLPLNPRIASKASIRNYGFALRYFGEFLGRPATIGDLNDETVSQYMRYIVDERKNKARTANNYAKRIIAIWNWCAKKRLVADHPTISLLPVPQLIPSCWLTEEMEAIHRACLKAPGNFGRVSRANYWIALHFFLWDTGERTGATRKLEWSWLDWKRGHIVVPPEARKGFKFAHYRLKPATVEALEAIRHNGSDLIFHIPGGASRFHYYYKLLILSAGLDWVPRKCGPQKMRRSFASYIEAAGGNATKALKHTDRRVTEESYLDPRVCDVHSENEKLPPFGQSVLA